MKPFTVRQQNNVRSGTLRLPHGKVRTPFFMPIATRGAVKHVAPWELEDLGATIILSNTYHLSQRPGEKFLKAHGGLHPLMGWTKPILTDSGGYQVFSLAKNRKITEEGARFRSEIDGHEIFLTPESVIDTQLAIGSDVCMVLDECPPYPATHSYIRSSAERTLRWATRSKIHFAKRVKKIPEKKRPLLFGIVQGGVFKDVREWSAKETVKLAFDGYAVGGVANGNESDREKKHEITWSIAYLPKDKPRYLMGMGLPEEIVWAVNEGVDMFDCIIPTREARHGRLYAFNRNIVLTTKDAGGNGTARPSVRGGITLRGTSFYRTMNIKRAPFVNDMKPVDAQCPCPCCTQFSRAYLRHLFAVAEPLGQRLATLHNLAFYLELMTLLQKRAR